MLRNALLPILLVSFAVVHSPSVHAQDYTPDQKVVSAVSKIKVGLAQALSLVQSPAVPISAKYEIEDKPSGRLSLSIYVASHGLHNSAASTWKEMAGSPETVPWKPTIETLTDAGDIAAATAQIKLLAKTHVTLAQIAKHAQSDVKGTIISITPVSESGRARFVVFVANGGTAREIDYDLFSGRLPALPH